MDANFLDERQVTARQAIKSLYGKPEGQYGPTLFVSQHLKEIEPAYWLRTIGVQQPEAEQVLDALVLVDSWTSGDGDTAGASKLTPCARRVHSTDDRVLASRTSRHTSASNPQYVLLRIGHIGDEKDQFNEAIRSPFLRGPGRTPHDFKAFFGEQFVCTDARAFVHC